MVLADDFVAFKFEQAADGIADDGASQMADMHLFCDIRAGKIDHNCFWVLHLADAEPVRSIGIDFKKPICDKFRFEAEIYKARPGNFRLFRRYRLHQAG